MRQELQEAGVGTSKAPSEEVGEAPEGGCEESEGPSGAGSADKGKGKEKEVQEEETLQE